MRSKVCALAVLLLLGAAQAPAAAAQRAYVINGTRYLVVPEAKVRPAGMPRRDIPDKKNAALPLMEACERYVRVPRGLQEQWDKALKRPWGDDLPKLKPWVRQNLPVIALVRQALEKPECQFPVLSRSGEMTIIHGIPLPYLWQMRQMARFMVVRGHELERQGSPRQALDLYLLAIRLGRRLNSSDYLITDLVGIAVEGIGVRAALDCLQRSDVDAAALAWLARELDKVALRKPDWTAAMRTERAAAKQAVYAFGYPPGAKVPGAPWAPDLLKSRAWRIVFPDRTMIAEIAAVYDRYVKLAALPPWQVIAGARAMMVRGRSRSLPKGVSRWNFIALMLLPALNSVFAKYVEAQARLGTLRAAVALYRYHAATGKWPDSLKALAPEFLPKEPLDPCTGKPLIYKPTRDGWKVYSVGRDLRDSGGDARRRKDIVAEFSKKERRR